MLKKSPHKSSSFRREGNLKKVSLIEGMVCLKEEMVCLMEGMVYLIEGKV